MGEIDTKPIESVQTTLSFFGQINEHQKNNPTEDQEVEKERQVEELANVKVQLEANDMAYKQALLESEKLSSDLFEAQEQLECMKKQLENRLMENSTCIHVLQMELQQANELHISFEKVTSDTISKLTDEMGLQEKKNLDQAAYTSLLETEVEQLRTELVNANEFLDKLKEKENDAQVEIALLKSELHKGRSKLAAAEARAQSEKSALFNALQQMGLEAEQTKNENRLLKEATKLANKSKISQACEETRENKEYDLSKKFEDEKQVHDPQELESMQKELEFAMKRIGELRARAEQAISRAEAAEKKKAALEEHIKRSKEHKERRKAAIAALREESISRDFSTSNTIKYDASAKNYQPLGKVLNMKF